METRALEKQIHDLAMAVRAGDLSKYDRLQELRQEYRELTGVAQPEAEAPKPAEPEQGAPEAKPKKSKKSKE